MTGTLLVSMGAAYLAGTSLRSALDVPEGELLTTAGWMGWLAAVGVLLIQVAPLVVGVVLAWRARLHGAAGRAVVPLVVNGVLLAYLVVTQAAQLLMG